ncbi:MAG: amino acid permease [Phycisphaerales bacterium]|nr:amino acid permease [Phycisphaerales bacterium]
MESASQRLKKHIGLFGVFAIALGTTISSGFFLLPGLAFAQAGPAIILSYLLAGFVMLLPVLCKAELTTAMPRAGGVYFYLDRAFGPMVGSIAGISSWIALTLKTSFALVGSGFYLGIFLQGAPMNAFFTWCHQWHLIEVLPSAPDVVHGPTALAIGVIAVCIALLFGLLNIMGAGKAIRLQAILVMCVVALLTWFVTAGSGNVDPARYTGFFDKGANTMISMVGVVLVSYMGLTKVASIAEEVKNPERNVPLGVLLALATVILLYVAGLAVMVGTIPASELEVSKTPAAQAALVFGGPVGQVVISIAAIASFLSVANAGILSASRYPFAMGRDHTMPAFFRALGRFGTPTRAVIATVALIVLEVLLLDPLVIAKYAGTMKLLLFSGVCMAVIVMRESRIDSYDPGFRVPLYPVLPLAGVAVCVAVIVMLGWVPVLFALGLIAGSLLWFHWYAAPRVRRTGAIHHVFARLGERRFDPLDIELRGIIKEKGLRKADPFEEVVTEAHVIDLAPGGGFTTAASLAAAAIAKRRGLDADTLQREFLEGTRVGATPVAGGAALPHTRSDELATPELVIVRCSGGMTIEVGAADHSVRSQHVDAIFFLVSPEEDPGLHLRLLASLAIAVEQPGFLERWRSADGPAELKTSLLRHERSLDVVLQIDRPGEAWIGRTISELDLPDDVIVTLVGRAGEAIVPRGSTMLLEGDRVVLLGEPEGIDTLRSSLS